MRAVTLILCIAALILSAVALHAEETAYPTFKAGARLFPYYRTNLQDSLGVKGANEFGIGRAYLYGTGELAAGIKYNVTLDVVSVSKLSYSLDGEHTSTYSPYSGWTARLKFAYGELSQVIPWTTLQAGVIPTPWNGVAEPVWGNRFMARDAIDEFGFLATADAGLNVTVEPPAKLGNLMLSVYNGTGYDRLETNRFKDISARLLLQPFDGIDALKGLKLMGFYYKGIPTEISNAGAYGQRDLLGAMLGYSYAWFTFGAEFMGRSYNTTSVDSNQVKSSVMSLHANIHLPFQPFDNKLWVFGRFDAFDPNTDAASDKDKINAVWAGLGWEFTKGFRVAAALQNKTYGNESSKPSRTLWLNADVGI